MTTFRGTVAAKAFVIDAPTIGAEEARDRVLKLWQAGSRLYVTPTGSWVLVLAEPVEVRAERAPGLPLTEAPQDLEPLDCAQWTDTSALAVHALTPADAPPPEPDPISTTIPDTPPLRARGRIKAPSQEATRLLQDRDQTPKAAFIVLAVFGVLAALLVALAVTSNQNPLKIALLLAFLAGCAAMFGTTGTTGEAARTRQVGAKEPRNLWVRLVMRTPFKALVRSQHEKYLSRLTEQFERKDWDNALRDAIGLGADGSNGGISLKLPTRRHGALQATTTITPGAGPLYGLDVQRHLKNLYQDAAAHLERAGRHDEAAFVHADLLGDPSAAVAMFERLGRFADAAELAEGRGLDAALVVRLWWRAGNKARATDVARARGAFAAAIERMNADEGRALRAEWVKDRQDSGDHLGAIAAAWPDEATRPMALPSIQAGMALGGPQTGTLLAHLVVGWPSTQSHATAKALLDDDDPELTRQRKYFADAWLALKGTELNGAELNGSGRELSSAAVRAFVRDGTEVPPALRNAADPLLAADLPRIKPPKPGITDLTFPALPGQLVVWDAVALRGGAVLVALGDQGTRLLTPDGRTRARWDVPAHQLVIADHGGSALLVVVRGTISEVHHLDLATRKARHWATVSHRRFVGSFDGGIAAVVGPDGLEFLDVRRPKPTVVWRELDQLTKIHVVARNEHSLAAVITQDDALQVWQWELPSLTLRGRRRESIDQPYDSLLPSGVFVAGDADGDAWFMTGDDPAETSTKIRVKDGVIARTDAVVHAIRHHAGIVTLFDQDSRVVALDTTTREQVASFATRTT